MRSLRWLLCAVGLAFSACILSPIEDLPSNDSGTGGPNVTTGGATGTGSVTGTGGSFGFGDGGASQELGGAGGLGGGGGEKH